MQWKEDEAVAVDEQNHNERDGGAPLVLREPQDEREGAPHGTRDGGAPLVLQEPQDERDGALAERDGAQEGEPSIRPAYGRPTRGEREGADEGQPAKKRGGGPKTPAGKARVRLNAVKHGVLAETPVLPLVEDEEEWLKLRRDVLDSFGLEGPFLESLGERVANLIWRLKRAGRAETEATRSYQDDVPEDWERSMRMEGLPIPDRKTRDRVKEEFRMLMARLLPGDEMMDKVLRYETRLHRFLLQTIYQIVLLKGLVKTGTGRYYGLSQLDPPGVSRGTDPPMLPGLPGG